MRIAAYARYSSDQQRDASIDDQLRNIRTYCARLGWPEPAVFQDRAISGARSDRPGYQALIDSLPTLDVVLVDDLSRLSRDSIETARVVRMMTYSGVRLIGVSDGVDTARQGHKIDVGLRGLMSELYLDDLADKTHRGLAGLAEAGYSPGGLPYGYRSIRTEGGCKRQIHPDQAPVVLEIYQRYADGWSPRAIAGELNRRRIPSPRGGTWAHSAIYGDSRGLGILNNELYIGRQIWNRTNWVRDPEGKRKRIERPRSDWIVKEQPELRVIPEELWTAVQARIKKKRPYPKGRGGKRRYLFSGLLRCGHCGGAYIIVDRYRYGCSYHKNRATCPHSRKVPRKILEERLLSAIREELLSESSFRQFEVDLQDALEVLRPDPGAARAEVRAASAEVENLVSAIREGVGVKSIKDALLAAEARLHEAEERLRQVESYQPAYVLSEAKKVWVKAVENLAEVQDVDAARTALHEAIGEIILESQGDNLVARMSCGQVPLCEMGMVAGAGFEPTTFGL